MSTDQAPAMPMQPVEPFAFELENAAALCGMTKRRLEVGIEAGEIAATRYRGRTVMTPDQIRRFLQQYERPVHVSSPSGSADDDIAKARRRAARRYGLTG